MKKILFTFFAILLCFPVTLQAQQKKNKVKTYKVWVTLIDGFEKNGILYAADEHGLKIMNAQTMDISDIMFVKASDINVIKLRQKGKVGMGALLGAAGGIAVGTAIGSSVPKEEGFLSGISNSMNVAGGIIIGTAMGTGIGVAAGSSKKVIQINNHLGVYKEQLPTLQSYSIKSKEQLIVNAQKTD